MNFHDALVFVSAVARANDHDAETINAGFRDKKDWIPIPPVSIEQRAFAVSVLMEYAKTLERK